MKKIILGIAGEIGSGKTSVAKYLQAKYQAELFSFSGMLRDILKRLYLPETRENLQTLSTVLRQNFSEDLMSKVIAYDIERSQSAVIVAEAVRRPSDIVYLKKLPNFYLINVCADFKNRYQRITDRGENSDDQTKTLDKFQKELQQESELKIKEIAKQANFVIDNNGNLEELYKQIDKIMNKILITNY
ncbi:MAG: AAA family ATPase [Candidatus Jacksonbacteria bacterium]